MKKFYLFGIPVLLLIAGFIILKKTPSKVNVKDGLIRDSAAVQKANHDPVNDKCCAAEPAGKYSDNSIYQLNNIWENENGKPVKLGGFKGHKVAIAMFYASCTSACPVLVGDIKKLEDAMPAGELNDYRFVLVSIDPGKDTPDKLKSYAEDHALDPGHWSLLRGSKDDVAALAQLLGFQYKRKQSGMYSHTNLITFLNKAGEISHQSTGLLQETGKLLAMAESSK